MLLSSLGQALEGCAAGDVLKSNAWKLGAGGTHGNGQAQDLPGGCGRGCHDQWAAFACGPHHTPARAYLAPYIPCTSAAWAMDLET